jgi:hypothetical protein
MGAQSDPPLSSLPDGASTARGQLRTARSTRECAFCLGGAAEQRSWQHHRQNARCRSLERPRCHGTLPRCLAKGWAAGVSRNDLLLSRRCPHRRWSLEDEDIDIYKIDALRRRNRPATTLPNRFLEQCSSGRLPPLRRCAHIPGIFHRCGRRRIQPIAGTKQPGRRACLSHSE